MNATEPLIHIGYHKTATSWLQRQIFASSGSGFAPITDKRLVDEAFVTVNPFRFDEAEARSRLDPLVQAAATEGRFPVISHERLSGFDLLGAYDAGVIADRIYATYPRARILIVIREQRDMMLSMYKQYVKKSGTASVGKLWGKRTVQQRRRPGPSLDVYEYHHLIGYYQRLFGNDRVLVLPFELLLSEPLAFVSRICAFVGVARPGEVPAARANVGIPGITVPLLRATNTILRALGAVSSDGGPITARRLQRARMRVIRRVAPKLPKTLSRPFDRRLRASVEALVQDRFAESNALTSGLIAIDLASLGYTTAPIPSKIGT
jgi:hypothetical protein